MRAQNFGALNMKYTLEEKTMEENIKEDAKPAKKKSGLKIIGIIAAALVIVNAGAWAIVNMLDNSEDDTAVSEIVTFGTYEQDNDTENGAEAIEWIVLDEEDGKTLLVSRYVLDCQLYNTTDTDVTWENCSLRKWLNDDFFNTAFTPEEQEKIETAEISANSYSMFSSKKAGGTADKVFLLSTNDLQKYYGLSDMDIADGYRETEELMILPTEYAMGQGVWTDEEYLIDGRAACWWWLLPFNEANNLTAFVSSNGTVAYMAMI